MKKIAIYNGQLFMGGIERVLINYLEYLALEPTLEITLIIKENIPEKNIFLNDIPKNIKIKYLKSEKLCKKTVSFSQNKKNIIIRALYQGFLYYSRKKGKICLRNFIRKNKFDAIIDFDTGAVEYLKGIKGLNIIGWTHFSLKGLKKKRQERSNGKFKDYNHIVVICDDMKKELKEMYPKYQDKGVRIYNPMNFERIEKQKDDESMLSKEDLELLKNDFFIGVSRLVPGKNRVEMVEIYNELKKRGRKEKLYILGSGSDRVNIEKKIEELNLKNDVLLLGEKKNPFPFMKKAKLFLHTSMGEGFGLVLVEAMLCDTIVVAYDCPTGPREILMNGKAGGLISLNDKKSFENKVIEILESDKIQKEIKKEMYKKLNEFSYEAIKESLFKLF